MHRVALLLIDLLVIAAATVFALILRDNLEVSPDRVMQIGPYLLLTMAAAVPVLFATGLNRTSWRYSSLGDYLLIGTAVTAITLIALALGFVLNRLENVARAMPIIQGLLMICGLIGVRVATRLGHAARGRTQGVAPSLSNVPESVLVVGLNAVTELFLRSVEEFASDRIKVAGLLGPAERDRGLLLRRYSVLGMPEEIDRVLRELEVHGVSVDRIVITTTFEQLSSGAQDALLHIEKTSSIRLDFFAERIGISDVPRVTEEAPAPSDGDRRAATLLTAEIEALALRPYFRWKRAIDAMAAAVAIVCLAPVALLVSIVVMLDAGHPAIFWQQRPGVRGWPFRLYKFRTMAGAHNADGRRLSDAERLSRVGRFLRYTHLDELPQLYNILIGEMSFVGPRPLLPADQPPAFSARLAVRPGLTGWAQIKGGRDLSASDKAALDVWYVRNASLRLDLQIIWGTLRTIWSKDRADTMAIRQAWHGVDHRLVVAQPPRRAVAHAAGVVPSTQVSGAATTPHASAIQTAAGNSAYR
jgi:lipopolysaccharide/colanic/teichoic acid biosynthesis glycosyltransferase